jgi:hypothetical protein
VIVSTRTTQAWRAASRAGRLVITSPQHATAKSVMTTEEWVFLQVG